MLELREDSGLVLEPRAVAGIGAHGGRQQLHGHAAAQLAAWGVEVEHLGLLASQDERGEAQEVARQIHYAMKLT